MPYLPIVLICGGMLLSLVILWFGPKRQTRYLNPKEKDERFLAENEARKTLAQIVGGIAILTGLYATNETLRLTESGQVTDRFTKATDQLGSEKMPVRIGGIFGLERLSRDSTRDDWRVMDLLTTFIRINRPWSPENKNSVPQLPADIQAALDVVSDREAVNDSKYAALDLSNLDLRYAYLLKRLSEQYRLYKYALRVCQSV